MGAPVWVFCADVTGRSSSAFSLVMLSHLRSILPLICKPRMFQFIIPFWTRTFSQWGPSKGSDFLSPPPTPESKPTRKMVTDHQFSRCHTLPPTCSHSLFLFFSGFRHKLGKIRGSWELLPLCISRERGLPVSQAKLSINTLLFHSAIKSYTQKNNHVKPFAPGPDCRQSFCLSSLPQE